jgi:hypothetical protein
MQRIDAGRPPTPPPPRGRGRLLKAAGLVAVAVVSGLVWWLIRHDSGGGSDESPTGQEVQTQQFDYAQQDGPVAATDCATNSYGTIKRWFAEHPCGRLSRALYTTSVNGSKVLVSVSLVTMPAPEQAQQLKRLTDTDNTGNVNDLVRDGTAKIPGAPPLAKGQYSSQVTGADVTIVLAEFFDKHEDQPMLLRVSTDALTLNQKLR